ncbi:S-adenosyl-L-methionine-dependent methyltransferase [Xylaria sp. FL1042]|nr:S-adenosyl-L-methionine-dependent methyltransferase [Xylaria sp. FL1042]
MPRLAPSLFRRAGRISPHLATLLPACRTLASAQIELGWIRRHVADTTCRRRSDDLGARHHDNDNNNNNNNSNSNDENNYRRENSAALSLSPRNGEDVGRHRGRVRGRRKLGTSPTAESSRNSKAPSDEDRVARLVARRGAGEPLQYVLGTQPFGDLEILCGKGVLIPRPETEAWASMLADLVFSSSGGRRREGGADGLSLSLSLRILDLCCGTGCIGLSLYARAMAALSRTGDVKGGKGNMEGRGAPLMRVFGFDVEPRAVRLAGRNLMHNFRGSRGGVYLDHSGLGEEAINGAVTFRQADIFANEWMAHLDEVEASRYEDGDERDQPRRVDILVSNPPYISQRGFEVDTGRSVRNYEPKIALVPAGVSSNLATTTTNPILATPTSVITTTCAPEDIFYARLLDVADTLRPRIAAFEVGDMEQAIRVAEMAMLRSRPQHDSSPETSPEEDGVGSTGRIAPRWDVVEIWRDLPDCRPSDAEEDVISVRGRVVPVRGSGHGRVVFLAEGQMMWNRFTNRGFRREVYTGS